jgi:hypothetical protein
MISRARECSGTGLVVPLVAAALVASAVVVGVRQVVFSSTSTRASALDSPALPASARPAFVIPEPRRLAASRDTTRWATVVRAVPVRVAADPDASALASLETRTPEGTTNVVPVVRTALDETGGLWIAVRIPALPSNVTGWVPRGALGAYSFVHTRLVVDLAALSADLVYDGSPIFSARIGIGKSSSPTPTGEYYIRSKVWSLRSPFYGPLAFGTSARSAVLTDWPGGGFIGIHGTNEPELLPGRVSHGCIRMRNEDILALGRLMPVGTPVTIR